MSPMSALARSQSASASARVAAPPSTRSPRRAGAVGRSPRGHLRVVTAAPRPARSMPFIVLCAFVLAVGLLVLLLLNMQLAKGSYALHDLQQRSAVLAEQEQQLTETVDAISAPGVLAARATKMGLVPGTSPAFLRLPDGQVLGVPQAAPEAPTPADGTWPTKGTKSPTTDSKSKTATGTTTGAQGGTKTDSKSGRTTDGASPKASTRSSTSSSASSSTPSARASSARDNAATAGSRP